MAVQNVPEKCAKKKRKLYEVNLPNCRCYSPTFKKSLCSNPIVTRKLWTEYTQLGLKAGWEPTTATSNNVETSNTIFFIEKYFLRLQNNMWEYGLYIFYCYLFKCIANKFTMFRGMLILQGYMYQQTVYSIKLHRLRGRNLIIIVHSTANIVKYTALFMCKWKCYSNVFILSSTMKKYCIK